MRDKTGAPDPYYNLKHMDLEHIAVVLSKDCLILPKMPLVVGVSGGPDSLCLLDSLARLGYAVHAAHFDHRLRPESGQDADVVRRVADGLGLPFALGSADVATHARSERLSVEEAARNLRYRFLFATARALGAQGIAVGHTADDQVETVLMHLLRGSGLAGLTGMSFRALLPAFDADLPVLRPLLGAWHSETLAYCQERGLPYVTDASNQDLTFFRNRLRHELLPLLADYNPQIRPALWRMAQVLSGDAEILAQAEQAAWEGCLETAQAGVVIFALGRLRACPLPLQRRLLRRAVALLRPSLRDVDFESVSRAVDFVRAPARSGQMDLLQGLVLLVEPGGADGRLLLLDATLGAAPSTAHWPQLTEDEVALPLPGELQLDSGWRLRAELSQRDQGPFTRVETAWEAWLDADISGPHLWVRRPRAGDRFQPLGMAGRTVKLSDFWINHKLPRRARPAWPLVCSGEQIAWVPGYRMGHAFRVTPTTLQVIHLSISAHE